MSGRRARHRQHANPFNIRGEIPTPAWADVYRREAPLALDVGFAGGMFLLELARKHPEWNVLGFEIRQHFVDGVLQRAKDEGLENVHAILANANLHTEDTIPPQSLAFVSVNFPDPWFKKRHQKRRVINQEWLSTVARKMRPGAELHIMTDFEPIGEDALAVLQAHADFEAAAAPGFLETSSTAILTERELTHLRRKDPIYRLFYRRRVPP